ncbi:PilZ domain-containing protein [Indiicoccus explosivorum]|uniref:PilZ domain-containing protein n=1 Tax=Indiicoccus explosivorum TaxID=1917864 RepID=UPI000B439259|nr:PilZ domain-containing protein [Indiicoccus explosivorum]
MFYKRSESFRYTFGQPVEAVFRILGDFGRNGAPDAHGGCLIVDLSPAGMRLFSELPLPEKTRLMVEFSLTGERIRTEGAVVWRQAHMSGSLYGVKLETNAAAERLIIEELKRYRRAEVGLQNK